MDVEMEHALATLGAFVDHGAVAMLGHTFLGGDFGDDDQQVTQECSMSVLSLANAGEPVTILWDDQEVLRCNGCDVLEREALLILKNDLSRDLLAHNLVKNGIFNLTGSRV